MFDFLKRLFNEFVFGNFFIAICSASMVWTTFLMNELPLKISPLTIFLTSATFLLYNFHRISFKVNYSDFNKMISSARSIEISPLLKIIYVIFFIAMIVSFFILDQRIILSLIPLSLLACTYSIPVLFFRKKRIRLLEFPLIKTPVLAAVWGISTTILPLLEQNITVNSSFVILQVASRCLFIFALCLPFEMRDLEIDNEKNVRTIPVVHGITTTKIFGSIILLLEIITHHLMQPISSPAMLMLDLSSVVAFLWIIFQNSSRKPFYYKFLIDGTMLLRFLLLLIVIHPV